MATKTRPDGSTPAVSVCIPSYNAAATIRETVESILAQTFRDIELVVVDDASTDKTVDILESFDDPRLSFFVNETNLGPAGNWNRAVELTTGKFVKLVCGDDLLDPTCLEHQVAILSAPENEQVVASAVRRNLVDENGKVLMKKRGLAGMRGRMPSRTVLRKTARSGSNPLGEPAAVLIRGDVLRSCLPWDQSLGYMIDIDMWTRVLDHGELYATDDTLATFRVSTNAWSGILVREQRHQAVAFIKRLRNRYPDVISATDIAIGTVNATLLARGRRATYWYIDRKK